MDVGCGRGQFMMTSSNGNILLITGHLCREFTGPRWIPRTKASDAELSRFLWSASKWVLSKQSWGLGFETLSCPLWRHCNINCHLLFQAAAHAFSRHTFLCRTLQRFRFRFFIKRTWTITTVLWDILAQWDAGRELITNFSKFPQY